MNLFGDHLLSVITFTPLVGAVLLMAIPAFKRNDDAVRWVANIFGVLGFTPRPFEKGIAQEARLLGLAATR